MFQVFREARYSITWNIDEFPSRIISLVYAALQWLSRVQVMMLVHSVQGVLSLSLSLYVSDIRLSEDNGKLLTFLPTTSTIGFGWHSAWGGGGQVLQVWMDVSWVCTLLPPVERQHLCVYIPHQWIGALFWLRFMAIKSSFNKRDAINGLLTG